METNAQELERRIVALERQMADQLAAAHRAGAIEAIGKLISMLETEKVRVGQISKWMNDEDRQEARLARCVVRDCINIAHGVAADYAEPEEEKKG